MTEASCHFLLPLHKSCNNKRMSTTLLTALRKAYDEDPFIDLSSVRDAYQIKQQQSTQPLALPTAKSTGSMGSMQFGSANAFTFSAAPITSSFPSFKSNEGKSSSFQFNPTPASSGFSFPASSSLPTFTPPTLQLPSEKTTQEEIQEEEGADDDGGVRTNDHLIVTGKGEEDDETLFSARAKLFRFDAKSSSWTSLATGLFKLNKTPATKNAEGKDIYRILCRTEGSGNVILNSRVFKEMAVKWIKGLRDVSITAHVQKTVTVDGKSTEASDIGQFRVKVKDPVQAEELYNQLLSALHAVESAT